MLETIARYDNLTLNGKIGIKKYDDLKLNFCNSKKALAELESIIKKARFKHIILSYSNEGMRLINKAINPLKLQFLIW